MRPIFAMAIFAFGCANAETLDPNAFPTACTAPAGLYQLSFTEHTNDTLVNKCGTLAPILTKFPIVADTNPLWKKRDEVKSPDNCFQSYTEEGASYADDVFCFGWTETIDMYRSFKPQEDGTLLGSLVLGISCDHNIHCASTYTIVGVPIQ